MESRLHRSGTSAIPGTITTSADLVTLGSFLPRTPQRTFSPTLASTGYEHPSTRNAAPAHAYSVSQPLPRRQPRACRRVSGSTISAARNTPWLCRCCMPGSTILGDENGRQSTGRRGAKTSEKPSSTTTIRIRTIYPGYPFNQDPYLSAMVLSPTMKTGCESFCRPVSGTSSTIKRGARLCGFDSRRGHVRLTNEHPQSAV